MHTCSPADAVHLSVLNITWKLCMLTRQCEESYQFVCVIYCSWEHAELPIFMQFPLNNIYITQSRTKCAFSGHVPLIAIAVLCFCFLSEGTLRRYIRWLKCSGYICVDTAWKRYTVWDFEPFMPVSHMLPSEWIKRTWKLCIFWNKQPTEICSNAYSVGSSLAT